MIRLLRQLVPHQVLMLLVTENVIIFCCFLLASSLVLDIDPTVYLLYDGGLLRILVVQATILLSLYFHDLYAEVHVRSRIRLVQYGFQVIGIAFLVQAVLSYLAPSLILPRWLMIAGCGLSLVGLLGWRVLYGGVVVRALGKEGVLFLGDSSLVREIAHHLDRHPRLGMEVLGCLYEQVPDAASIAALRPLGAPHQLREVVSSSHPDLIVVGLRDPHNNTPLMDLLDLRLSGIRVEEVVTTFERVLRRVPIGELRPDDLMFMGEPSARQSTAGVQFVASTVLALIGILLAAPFMLVWAVARKLISPGPILHRQTRVGREGSPFTRYTFRSMYRLDELPQLINVLRGEMSLVGPRPERPEFVQRLSETIPFYTQRQCVRPGLTGWAQINYKCGDTPEDAARKLEYELYYIKHLSLALNLYILFHTLKKVVSFRGAQ